jgi:hypothetical protein
MTSSPALVALAAAAAWFLVFFFVHIGGVRAGLENARWLLISYAACFLGTLVTAIVLTAWHHGMQAVILAATMAALTSACLFALYIPALYTLLASGYVAPDGPSYRLTARGRAIAKLFRPIKILWNLGPGG